MKPIRLQANNFLSWKELDYIFDNRVIALSGDNKTEEDQGSNGSGKSGILQMIYFAYTGNNIRGVLDKKLIRQGEKEAVVLLDTYCPVRKQLLSIERILNLKGSGKLSISINDEPVEVATVLDGNKFILNWLSISSEDLKNYYLICKEYYKSFFKSSNTEKLGLISRFVNFSYLDNAKPVIEEEVSTLEKKRESLSYEKSSLSGKKEVLTEQLEAEQKRDIQKEREDAIRSWEEECATIMSSCTELDKHIEDKKSQIPTRASRIKAKEKIIARLQEELSSISLDEFKEIYNDLAKESEDVKKEQAEYLEQQRKAQEERGKIKRELQAISVKLAGKVTCPNCKHVFLTLTNTTLEKEMENRQKLLNIDKEWQQQEEEAEEALKDYEEVFTEIFKIKADTEQDEEAVKQTVNNLKKNITDVQDEMRQIQSEIKILNNNIDEDIAQLKHKKDKIQWINEEIERIRTMEMDTKKAELEKSIASLDEKIEDLNKKIADKMGEIHSKNEWIGKFKEFKMLLALEQIKNIQYAANDILKKEKSDLRLMIEGFKANANGKIKEEITPYILRDQLESFWYYSGGERARVEIAFILAIQTLINSTNPYGGLDFLFIDEVTEGLSEKGLYNVIDALKFIKYPVFIATQVDNQSVKCDALKVEKLNGISRLVK